ncbi:MAG TPA: protein-disulfide reductase DsbD domain-containing protein [Candidatus Acidoferrum sp.]|jgi:DsbC/DsbD-like thiol-disulfide interchange protein|nr:protein-disulfide reductase DsbD domain-containing protein [Candidatus Acidoferrum sp.]
MQIRRAMLFCALLLACAAGNVAPNAISAAAAQSSTDTPAPAAIVKPRAFVSLAPVPRGKEFQVALAVDIAHGYHMNSHHPTDKYLIPTTLTPKLPTGFELLDTIYPAGRIEKFSFSPDKGLDVYSSRVTLKLRLIAHNDAPIGAVTFPVTLRYQACNDTTCLPPVKVPVDVRVDVAAAGASTHSAHPEIFSTPPAK